MREILIILACVPLYVLNSFCDKYVSSRCSSCNPFLYNCIKFFAGAVCLLPVVLADDMPRFGMGAMLCGIGCGIIYAVSKTVILRGYEKTSVAFMTLCHASGMILPCVLGHFFWSERMDALSLAGILLAVASVVLLKEGGKMTVRAGGIILGVIIFLTSGGVMVIQKLMGLYFAEESVTAYNFYSFVSAFLILCFFVRRSEKSAVRKKALWLCGGGSAVSLAVISVVMTGLAKSVPSVILFPLFNGLGIILVCLGSAFVFKERLTKRKCIGLVCGIIGLCLVSV